MTDRTSSLRIHYSPDYTGTGVAFDTTRKATVVAEAMTRLFGDRIELVAPVPLTRAELLLAHDGAYIDAVRTGRPDRLARSNGIDWDGKLFGAAASSNGGVRDAARWATRTGRTCGSLSSGLHHARPDRGNGYCTFNGLAVAARAALLEGATRVAIIDFDAHAGGGTAAIIEPIDGIEQYDVSVAHFDGYADTRNARLVWSNGRSYLDDIAAMLGSIPEPADIDLVIYNAGMDPHEDAGGVAGITTEVLAMREHMLFDWAARHDVPVAWVLAGGYTGRFDLAGVAELHCLTAEAAMAAAR